MGSSDWLLPIKLNGVPHSNQHGRREHAHSRYAAAEIEQQQPMVQDGAVRTSQHCHIPRNQQQPNLGRPKEPVRKVKAPQGIGSRNPGSIAITTGQCTRPEQPSPHIIAIAPSTSTMWST